MVKKKSATDLGRNLGRALDHNQEIDTKQFWRDTVQSNAALSNLVTTVRIKGGMTEEAFASQVLYVSGQKNTKENRTGSRAITDILVTAELLQEKDGSLTVSKPANSEAITNAKTVEPESTDIDTPDIPVSSSKLPEVVQPTSTVSIPSSVPSIAINIQLHLPETDNAEVYEKLFKALREQLISPKE